MPGKPDVAIVGGGIVGLATGLALTERHSKSVVIVEAESSVGAHQTGHNSGVIHSGLYYTPGSLKARLCRSGLELMYRFCEEEGVPHHRSGKLVVATADHEVARLDRLEQIGRGNGVALRRVAGPDLSDVEPKVIGKAGLWIEETGVVDYLLVAGAIRRRLERRGVTILTDSRVTAIRQGSDGFTLETASGSVTARSLVTCAGLHADRVARMAGADPDIQVVAVRGEYYRLRPERADLVRGLIYPVPNPELPFLGVHFTRRVDGTVDAGPNAVLATHREGYHRSDFSVGDMAEWLGFPGFWRMGLRHWRTGLSEIARSWSKERFVQSLRQLIPDMKGEDLEEGAAGVRAQALGADGSLINDFCFLEQRGALHVLNAPSPAATASLAIGRTIADRLLSSA